MVDVNEGILYAFIWILLRRYEALKVEYVWMNENHAEVLESYIIGTFLK